MKRIKLLLATVMALGLTLGLAGAASAATISCGQCHGVYINNPDGTKSVMPGVAATEDVKTPQAGDICGDKGRGLHGIHMNYSSATYGRAWDSYKKPAAGLADTRGTCSLCHNKHVHENGYVEFSGMTYTDARSDMKVSSVVKVSGTGITANGLDITQMDGTATCTAACHKGTSATNSAQWGNYTSVSMALTCSSCHSDASNNGADLSSPSGYGHTIHLTGSYLGSGANKTRIVVGNYSGYLNAGNNSACQFCHPDNRNDRYSQGRADDGSKKAYPHAKDGTNVLSKNANIGGTAGVVLANWTGTYMAPMCTASCHVQRSTYQTSYARWNGGKPASGTFSNCEICHQHQALASVNNSSNVPLSYAHSIHFANLSSAAGRVACGTTLRTGDAVPGCHASVHTNYAGLSMITRLPVTPGYAGIDYASQKWSRNGAAAVDGTCTNNCHTKGSPAWNTIPTGSVTPVAGCTACHAYPSTASTGSGTTWVAGSGDWTSGGNGHTVRASVLQNNTTAVSRKSVKHLNKAAAYNALTDTYAGVTGDANLCGKCHSGGTHMNSTIDINANNGLGTSCTPNFTFNNISTGSRVTCSNASCHFGKTTPNWY